MSDAAEQIAQLSARLDDGLAELGDFLDALTESHERIIAKLDALGRDVTELRGELSDLRDLTESLGTRLDRLAFLSGDARRSQGS